MTLTPRGQRDGADSGNPQVASAVIHNTNGIHVGVWECTAGGWPIENRQDCETATIISGIGRITDCDGTVHELDAGTVITLPKGWSGRWDITETLRKVYVIVS
ncbi:MAG: cupin domain-containing protein [Alphaproteobacteria bacterium]